MTAFLLAAALSAQTPVALPQVEVAEANWSAFERIDSRLAVPTDRMVAAVERIIEQRQCPLPGQTRRRFNINVSYAIRFDAEANVQRVVVEDIGCRPLEVLVGGIVSDMLRHSFFNLPERRAARWYSNMINFNLAS